MIPNVWRRSSFCTDASCVEVSKSSGELHLRNSTHPDASAIRFSAEEFRDFVAGVKAGEFDDLVADA